IRWAVHVAALSDDPAAPPKNKNNKEGYDTGYKQATPTAFASSAHPLPRKGDGRSLPISFLAVISMASFLSATTVHARDQLLMDAGWRFHLGDPADVTTNVTWYPEISDLAKLESNEIGAGTNTETYMETIRVDIFATHSG